VVFLRKYNKLVMWRIPKQRRRIVAGVTDIRRFDLLTVGKCKKFTDDIIGDTVWTIKWKYKGRQFTLCFLVISDKRWEEQSDWKEEICVTKQRQMSIIKSRQNWDSNYLVIQKLNLSMQWTYRQFIRFITGENDAIDYNDLSRCNQPPVGVKYKANLTCVLLI
jgi:hypothetical protein